MQKILDVQLVSFRQKTIILSALPSFFDLPTNRLSSIFEHTTNSYKLYWFYAILQLVKYENRRVFTLDEVTIRVITSAWYTVNFFKVSLGKQDQIAEIIKVIKRELKLDDNCTEFELQNALSKAAVDNPRITSAFGKLQRYVPFRILAIFFSKELRGLNDARKNKEIVELSEKSFFDNSLNTSLYRFFDNKTIEINPIWHEYFTKNIKILEGFCLYNLIVFLQNRNPNIPNIGHKLFFPVVRRDLKLAREFWNLYISSNQLSCIFSGQEISKKSYSIDHFIPWSFVTHDLIWNLIPTTASVNSSKNNNIPKIEIYLPRFVELHYSAFQFIFMNGRKKLLEDYSILLDLRLENIFKLSQAEFSDKLSKQISPLSQIAENAGFTGNWSYP